MPGISFSGFSYFWYPPRPFETYIHKNSLIWFRSAEFWGSLGCNASRFFKVQLFGFLAIAGIIAAAAGPSSAILMIPQNRTWTTGSIDFHLNGATDQLWPTTLTASHIGGPGCNTSDAITNPKCAAGGYPLLDNHYRILSINPLLDVSFILADELSTRMLQGNIRNNCESGSETFMVTPHVATVTVEEPLRQAWSSQLRNVTRNIPYGDNGGQTDSTHIADAAVSVRGYQSGERTNADSRRQNRLHSITEYISERYGPAISGVAGIRFLVSACRRRGRHR